MGKCKNCQYWDSDIGSKERYSSNFGYYYCDKFAYSEDLYDEKYNFDKKKCDKCHIIYSDSEGLAADLIVHKEFGCINFKNNK